MTRKPLSIISATVTQLLDELRIQDPSEIDVELIAASKGVSVIYKPLNNEEGHLFRTDDIGLIAVDESALASYKWRFVVAHELGHYLAHPTLDQFKLCTDTDLNSWYQNSGYEPEANQFAAELLMPTPFIKPRCDVNRPSLRDVKKLAKRFQTSLTSTAIRFVEFCPEPCAVVYSTAGTVEWTSKTKNFPFFIPKGMKLTNETYAGDLHNGLEVEDRPQLIDGSGWASGREIDLQEHSVKLGRYNSVLTLLWHKWK